jgi:ribosome recycling factor
MTKEIIKDAQERMRKSVESFRNDLTRLRTGRAHPSLLDHIMVNYYGSPTPLTQTATVSAEDARTLNVSVWDKSAVEGVEKAILESNLGLNPNTSGTVIRIPLPPLNEERRKELVKVLKNEGEQAKVAVRNVRRDAITKLKELVKNKDISEDDERKGAENAQGITDKSVADIDEIVSLKEREMLEI